MSDDATLAQTYRKLCHDLRGDLQILTTRLAVERHTHKMTRSERDTARDLTLRAIAELAPERQEYFRTLCEGWLPPEEP